MTIGVELEGCYRGELCMLWSSKKRVNKENSGRSVKAGEEN